ncbi:hypothetical protein GH714_039784 [Hevea brasiliensis]|uniref:Galactinol--sucrose galactosyltransferase n=1 Tax=Hevea brasiliensis TaxID=3981 RepID=A0A6A6MKQ2_HEVBR|nr:hypothetical protein GH714_039784 [Hevea brasiliensis]
MRDAFTAVRVHLRTFRLLEEKKLPNIVDKFGLPFWDAFYLSVEPFGLWHGVKSFAENGFAPRFLILDDGWQSINMDHESPCEDSKDLTTPGSQMLCRLFRFQENEKFTNQHDEEAKEEVADVSGLPEPKIIEYLKEEEEGASRGGLKALVSDMKAKFPSLDDVHVWHALAGAWGGLDLGLVAWMPR